MKPNILDVLSINSDDSLMDLSKSEENLQDGALTCSRSPNDSNLHPWLDFEGQVLHSWLQALSEPH